jgi:hypothetical protein
LLPAYRVSPDFVAYLRFIPELAVAKFRVFDLVAELQQPLFYAPCNFGITHAQSNTA